MFLFKKKPKTYLGLDIGASAIKLVELEKEEERFKLKTYGIFPLTDYLKQIGQQIHLEPLKMPDQQIAEMIKRTIAEAQVESQKACLSIPIYSSFSVCLDLPPMPEKEIEAALPFEAQKYVPLPISEVILDWRIINRPIQPNSQTENTIQVFLVAVPKENIIKLRQIIQIAGLELQAIEAEVFSLVRSLVGNDKSTIVLVDLGARANNISIIDQGQIRISHNFEMAGVELTRLISQKMDISPEKAEELKKSKDQRQELREIVYSILERIIFEINKVINSYQTKYHQKIEKCILVGGCANLPGLIDYFMTKLGLEVSLGYPFARVVSLPILEPVLKELGPSLAVAVGLAMRE